MANIMITKRCNLRCPYCFAEEFVGKSSDDITIDNFRTALDFALTNPNEEIGLIGGEPTVHSHFKEILEVIIHDDRVRICTLFTNGILIDKYINQLSHPKFKILINCNSPTDIGEKAFQKMKENIHLFANEFYMQERVTLGINMYVAPKPAYVAPNTTVSTYNPSEYYKQKDLEAQARANNSISTSVTKKAEPAATSSATPRINSAEDAKTYYNTLNGTSGSTNSNSGNVKTAANNVSSNISTTPNGTGKTNVTVTQQVKDNAAAVSNKVTTTTPKLQTTSKIVPGAPTEYYDNIAGKVASDNKQATTSSPKTVNVKSTYNPSEYYKQKDLETQAKYVAPKAISAESKVTKPYNPGEYYKQKDLTAHTRAKTLLGSNIPKLSANNSEKNLGINFDWSVII